MSETKRPRTVCEFCEKWEDRCECDPTSKRYLRQIAKLEAENSRLTAELEQAERKALEKALVLIQRMRPVSFRKDEWGSGYDEAIGDVIDTVRSLIGEAK